MVKKFIVVSGKPLSDEKREIWLKRLAGHEVTFDALSDCKPCVKFDPPFIIMDEASEIADSMWNKKLMRLKK